MTTILDLDFRRPLQPSEMRRIRNAIEDGGEGWAAASAALVEFFDIALGTIGIQGGLEALAEGISVDPTRIQIPEYQWAEIAGMLTKVALPDEPGALMWMNTGPSAYTPKVEGR